MKAKESEKELCCRDVGVDCDFVARGKDEKEILAKAADHARKAHNMREIPKELLKFKSEYHYLFSMLYHFDKNETGIDDFDCLLSLPNVTRRFMEAFGGIMIPLSMGLNGKMERLFPNEVERERVWKFVNHYSHNTTIERSLRITDPSESSAVVRACLKAVQGWNLDYFKELETEITENGAEQKTASGH